MNVSKDVSFSDLQYIEDEDVQDEKFKLLRQWVKGAEPQNLLDIGVGTAYFYTHYVPELLEKGIVSGVDIQQEFLDVAAQRGVKVKHCNVEIDRLPYENAIFELVMCDSILEHTLKPKRLLEEIRRVLKPGGILLLSVPSGVSAKFRWRTLRGSNMFFPIIDNLFNRDFMKRCAIFYSPYELERTVGSVFKIQEMQFTNIPTPRRTIAEKLLALWSRLVPTVRDVISIRAVVRD